MRQRPEKPINRERIRLRDLSWACSAVFYRAGVNLLPAKAHLKIARTRGRIVRRVKGTPISVIENLRRAFPQLPYREIRAIADHHVEFSQQTNLERILPLLSSFRRGGAWRIEGQANLDNALSTRHGVLLLTAHYGYPRLIVPALRFRGYDAVRVVAETLRGGLDRSRRWDQWAQRNGELGRRFASLFLEDILGSGNLLGASLDIRPILNALSANKVVVVAGDGMVSTSFVPMKLLGKRYPFPTGYMKIALSTGAPVVPAFAEAEGGDMVIKVYPPLQIKDNAAVEHAVGKWVEAFENRLRMAPQLWTRWGNRNLWERALAWAQKDAATRFMRHSPWGREGAMTTEKEK